MTIETKYHIGQEVWGEWYIEIEKFKVKGISIIVEGNKYRVLMWYNKHQWNHFSNKSKIVRDYIQLFII